MRPIIRKATEDDYSGISKVFKEMDEQHAKALPEVFFVSDESSRSKDFICDAIVDDDTLFLVAEADGQIVGLLHSMVRSVPNFTLIVQRKYLQIDTVGVLHDYRRRGIGKALMDESVEWARLQGIAQVELTVWEFNQGAIKFYESLGFYTTSRRMWKKLNSQEVE